MALKDFLRKIFKEEKQTPHEILEIPLANLLPNLTKEQEKLEAESGEIKKQIDSNLTQFVSALISHQTSLTKVNIDSRKEQERIKLIVKENLKHYINHLESFTDELKKIEEQNLKDFLQKIFLAIHNFEIISRNSFEKATILIGELGKVRQEIRNFQSKIDSIVSENKSLFDKEEVIENLKKTLSERGKIKETTEEIKGQIKKTENKQKEIESEITNKKKEIEKLKSSAEHRKEQEEKAKHEQENVQFSQEVTKIKEKIDLKFLAKHFHQDAKKSKVIERYIENFLETLGHDENLGIESLIKEAKNIGVSLSEIKARHKTLSQPLFLLIEEKISFLEREVKNFESSLFLLKEEKDRYEKAIGKLDGKRGELERDIGEKAKSMDVAII